MTVGQAIAARRKELHMSQEELAQKLGYKSRSTINKIELGINEVSQKKIGKFAEALDCSPAQLIDPASSVFLSDDEAKFLSMFSRLSPEQQSAVVSLIASFLKPL